MDYKSLVNIKVLIDDKLSAMNVICGNWSFVLLSVVQKLRLSLRKH